MIKLRLAWLPPILFFGAIIIGVILSFAVASITSPHPVEQPKIVLTLVPTPAPVLIQPTSAPVPQEQSSDPIVGFTPALVVMCLILFVPLMLFTVAILLGDW